MRCGRRLFQLFLITFAALSLLVSFNVIRPGVDARIILPLSGPGVQQCNGGSCPVPTQTAGGGGCNPYDWSYYGSKYGVTILSADTDKSQYRPGDVVTITGSVQLMRQDYWVNECGEVGVQEPVEDDASSVTVTFSGPYGTFDAANNGGSFTGTVNVPVSAESRSVNYQVTATYSSASDAKTVSFTVAAFEPALAASIQGTVVYPGDTATISGTGWKPDGTVTLDYGNLGPTATVTVDSSGSLTAPPITIPSDTAENAYTVTGTEAPNLEASVTITVSWRQLTVAIDPISSVQQGGSTAISGTVTDNQGKAVGGVSVSFAGGGGLSAQTVSTDSSGRFTSTINVPSDAAAQSYSIQATAQKTPGYMTGSATASLTVSCPPYSVGGCPRPVGTPAGVLVAATGALVGTGVAVGVAGSEDGGDEGDTGTGLYRTHPPDAPVKGSPCVDQEGAFMDAKFSAVVIMLKLNQLRNMNNSLETSYVNASESAYYKSLFAVLMFAAGSAATSYMEEEIAARTATFYRGLSDPPSLQLVLQRARQGLGSLSVERLKALQGLTQAQTWAEVLHWVETGYHTAKTGGEMTELSQLRGEISDSNDQIRELEKEYDKAMEDMDEARFRLNLCHDSAEYRRWYRGEYDREPPPAFPPSPKPTEQGGEAGEEEPALDPFKPKSSDATEEN